MSDTNRVALRIVEESVLGETPVTPAFEQQRITGAPDLAFTPATVASEELRADRQVSDLILVGGSAGGSTPGELSFRSKDDLIEGAFFDVWSARFSRTNDEGATEVSDVAAAQFNVTDEGDSAVADDIIRTEGFGAPANNGFFIVDALPTNTTIPVVGGGLTVENPAAATARIKVAGRQAATGDIVAATGPDSLTSTILDFTTLDIEPGDWLKIAGFTTSPADNDWVRVLSVAANLLVFDVVPVGWAADAGAGDTVQLYLGERIVNGVDRHSYTVEREFTDQTPPTFEYLRGMVVDGWTLNATPQAVVTDQFTFLGLNNEFTETRFAGATTIPSPLTPVMNSSSNVGRIAQNGVQVSGENFVLEASIEIANNLRNKDAVGFLGATDIGVGEITLTGTLNTYFDNKDLVEQVTANAETSFDMRFQDSQSHVMVFDMPRTKYSEGAPSVPGKNEDVVANLSYQALIDPVLGYTIKAMRFNGVQ